MGKAKPKYYALILATGELTPSDIMVMRVAGRKQELLAEDGNFVPVNVIPDEDERYSVEITTYTP